MRKMLKKSRLKTAIHAAACVAAIFIILYAAGYYRTVKTHIDSLASMPVFTSKDRILIFAPHCDDEVLGTGGLIQESLARGAAVKVVLITNGDNNIFSTDIEYDTLFPTAADFIKAGEERQRETVAGLGALGLKPGNVIFLGFPDRGIKLLYKKYRDGKRPYRSRGTRDTRAPYRLIYEPHVEYYGKNLLRNITEIIVDFKPTVIVAPHVKDHHPDHRYAFRFINDALHAVYTQREQAPKLYTYLVHYPHFPAPWGFRPLLFLKPPFKPRHGGQWNRLALTAEQETIKHKSILRYKSQLKVTRLGTLMKSFVRRNEIFQPTGY